ncbi:MAG: DUF2304 domain-containing protein [Lachnospiraceae bacterium]|nr:DUF2304 domain-containing protein [Lachnospiraceae bacterium]
MSTTLRTLLLVASVITAIWILRKIRKNGVKQEDALFWVCFAIVLAVLGVFPKVSYMMAELFGIMAPSNFVFMIIIAILIEKLFSLSIQISWLENKVEVMAAELAIRCKNIEDSVSKASEDDNESQSGKGLGHAE